MQRGLLWLQAPTSAALKNPHDDSYPSKEEFPEFLLATNIGIDKPYELGLQPFTKCSPFFSKFMSNLMQSF